MRPAQPPVRRLPAQRRLRRRQLLPRGRDLRMNSRRRSEARWNPPRVPVMMNRATFALGALVFGVLTAAVSPAVAGEGNDGATAFHYGAAPPVQALAFFERVVLDPEQAPAAAVQALTAAHVTVLARVPFAAPGIGAARGASELQAMSHAALAMAHGYIGVVVEPAAAVPGAQLASFIHAVHVRWPAAPLWIQAS